MARIIIDKELCKSCELCVSACPKKILAIGKESNRKGYFYVQCVDMDSCVGCASCAITCPDCVIEVLR